MTASAGEAPVSIVFLVPFWGDVDLLSTTLESLVAQTDPRFSVVVVDDASPRGAAVSALVAGLDDRFVYMRNPHNLGITANFQHCLDLATADYVVFLGCDDVVLPGYTSAVRGALTMNPRATMVQPQVVVIDAAGAPVRPLADRVKRLVRRRFAAGVPLTGDTLAASLLDANWLYFPALAFRRDDLAAVGFDDRWRVVEDLAAVLDLLFRDGSLVLVAEPAFAYRRHSASLSSEGVVHGWRFVEESAFFREAELTASALGWRRSRRAARSHWSSRVHALCAVPAAWRLPRRPRAALVRALLRHAFRPPSAGPSPPRA